MVGNDTQRWLPYRFAVPWDEATGRSFPLGGDGAPGLHPLRPWNRAKPLICNPDQLGDSARSDQIA